MQIYRLSHTDTAIQFCRLPHTVTITQPPHLAEHNDAAVNNGERAMLHKHRASFDELRMLRCQHLRAVRSARKQTDTGSNVSNG